MGNPFLMFWLCSTAVPRPVMRDGWAAMLDLMARQRPLGITNLGSLDGAGLALADGGVRIESFESGLSGFAAASVLTVYTIDGAMRFSLRGHPFMTPADAAAEAERATALLLAALDGSPVGR